MRDLLNYDDEIICPVCNAIGRIKKRDKRVSDLTIKEYDKITTNRIVVDDISTRDGVPVPKEY